MKYGSPAWHKEMDALMFAAGRHAEKLDQLSRDICQALQKTANDGTDFLNKNGKGKNSPRVKSDLRAV